MERKFREGRSCVQYVERDAGDRLLVSCEDGGGCGAYVGYEEGMGARKIDLNKGCYHDKTLVMHEFLHATGFEHTQTRHDRDEHVKVNLQNLNDPRSETQFTKGTAETHELVGNYDFNSLMHYSSTAWGRNKAIIIDALDDKYDEIIKSSYQIKNRKDLSKGDIETMKYMFPEGKCGTPVGAADITTKAPVKYDEVSLKGKCKSASGSSIKDGDFDFITTKKENECEDACTYNYKDRTCYGYTLSTGVNCLVWFVQLSSTEFEDEDGWAGCWIRLWEGAGAAAVTVTPKVAPSTTPAPTSAPAPEPAPAPAPTFTWVDKKCKGSGGYFQKKGGDKIANKEDCNDWCNHVKKKEEEKNGKPVSAIEFFPEAKNGKKCRCYEKPQKATGENGGYCFLLILPNSS